MCFSALRHACRRWLGMILSRIPLHQVDFVLIDGVELVRKRRARYAWLIIVPGNLFLKITRSPVAVLPLVRWLAWERAVGKATGRCLVQAQLPFQRSEHWTPSIPGRTLSQVLTDKETSQEQKFDAIRWSLAALLILHEHEADWGEGTCQSISHGDATANNVIVNIDTGTACWIDFETRHQVSLSEADRRADDLRAVIYSAAVHLPASGFPALADVLVASQIDADLIRHFHLRLTSDWQDLTVAQLAQSPLRWSAAMALRAALLSTIDVALRGARFRSDTSSSL